MCRGESSDSDVCVQEREVMCAEVRVVTVMCMCSLIPRPPALSLAVWYRECC